MGPGLELSGPPGSAASAQRRPQKAARTWDTQGCGLGASSCRGWVQMLAGWMHRVTMAILTMLYLLWLHLLWLGPAVPRHAVAAAILTKATFTMVTLTMARTSSAAARRRRCSRHGAWPTRSATRACEHMRMHMATCTQNDVAAPRHTCDASQG